MTVRRESFPVNRPQLLELRVPSGQLDVRCSDVSEVTVEISGRNASEFNVTQSGSTVHVEHEGRRGIGGASHEVVVTAPAGSRLLARVASANITTDGEFGDVTIATASGDALIGSSVEGLDVKTASGRLEVELCTGPLRVRTASGRVQVSAVTRDASIATASGDISIIDATGDVNAKTASGRIVVDRFDGEHCSLKTVSGGVRVGVPLGRTVQVDLQSLSGRIDLPSEPGEHSGTGREIRIKAKTVSGNIVIATTDDPEAPRGVSLT